MVNGDSLTWSEFQVQETVKCDLVQSFKLPSRQRFLAMTYYSRFHARNPCSTANFYPRADVAVLQDGVFTNYRAIIQERIYQLYTVVNTFSFLQKLSNPSFITVFSSHAIYTWKKSYFLLIGNRVHSSPSILQPSILRLPLIIRLLDLVPKGNFLC